MEQTSSINQELLRLMDNPSMGLATITLHETFGDKAEEIQLNDGDVKIFGEYLVIQYPEGGWITTRVIPVARLSEITFIHRTDLT